MAKSKYRKKTTSPSIAIGPEEALRFLEDMRQLQSDRDEPTIAISLRVPANLLRAVKTTAKSKGQKYQSLIIQLIREGLKNS